MERKAAFWGKWYKANELEKVELVETLVLPSRRIEDKELYKHQCASLINAYLVDLAEYLKSQGVKK